MSAIHKKEKQPLQACITFHSLTTDMYVVASAHVYFTRYLFNSLSKINTQKDLQSQKQDLIQNKMFIDNVFKII